MDIEIERYVGAVTREFDQRDHEGAPAYVVRTTRVFDTGIEDLWDALTNAQRIPRWFTNVSGDLRLGGQYQVQDNASGTITACDSPNRFAATWEFGGDVSWIEVALTAVEAERTQLVLEHLARVDDDRKQQYGPGAVGVGWDLSLLGLGLHLAGAAAVDPKEIEAWSVSEQGAQFVTQTSDDWGRASIAFGTPEAEALAAAANTTAFYTGAEPHTHGDGAPEHA